MLASDSPWNGCDLCGPLVAVHASCLVITLPTSSQTTYFYPIAAPGEIYETTITKIEGGLGFTMLKDNHIPGGELYKYQQPMYNFKSFL